MIRAEVRKHKGNYIGFEIKGHAGYAAENFDIVCAAVSALSINAVNSLEQFTDVPFESEDRDGFICVRFQGDLSPEAKLLMDSLVLGLTDVEKGLNHRYFKLIIREV